MDTKDYNRLKAYGKTCWAKRGLTNLEGWEDCVQQAMIKIYEFNFPRTEWEQVIADEINKEAKRIGRRGVDTTTNCNIDNIGIEYNTPESILIKLESGEL